MPASIRVENERETGHGWAFDVIVESAGARGRRLTIELSWVDYEYWTLGQRQPAALVRDLVCHLAERVPLDALVGRLDASTIRRRYPEIDRLLGPRSAGGE